MDANAIFTEGELRKQLERFKGTQKISDMKKYRNGSEGTAGAKSEETRGLDYWTMRAVTEETFHNITFEQTVMYTKLLGLPLPEKLKSTT